MKHDLSLEAFYTLSVLEPDEKAVRNLRISDINWPCVVQWSLQMNSALVLYGNLRHHRIEQYVDPSLLHRLKERQKEATYNNLCTLQRFLRIATSLEEADIKFLPLKGLSLMTDTYPESDARLTSDIDLFIHPRDFTKCKYILEKLSYWMKCHLTRGVISNHGQESEFSDSDGTEIDLHYRFFSWHEEKYFFNVDSRYFYDRARESRWRGAGLYRLRKEDEFYYLLMCLAKERFSVFHRFIDADAILRVHGSQFDWDLVKYHLYGSPLKRTWFQILVFLAEKLKNPVLLSGNVFPLDPIKTSTHSIFSIERGLWHPPKHKIRLQMSYLFSTKGIRNKIGLVRIYLMWQLFKMFGWFRSFFATRNAPDAKIYDDGGMRKEDEKALVS